MITPPLRRAALAAAVLSFFAAPAAAQGDAAFAAALGAATSGLAAAAQIKAKPQKPAAKPPAADDAVWRKVLETVKRDGKFQAGGGFAPSVFSIEDKAGDPKADHTMRGVSFLGLINDEEQFEAMGALFVFQDFMLDAKDGNWRVDQWMFETDVYGEVAGATHGTIIQTPDGKTVSAVPEKLSPSDPRLQAQFDALLKHWAERKPSGA